MTTRLPPFRFGIQCSSPPDVDRRHWTDLARRLEDLGVHRMTVSDHLDDQLAPFAALMAADTLPAYRKRGLHTLLLHARLAAATAAGCDLA